MEFNKNQIQNFRHKDLEPIVGKLIKITLENPMEIKGTDDEQIILIGNVNHIGLSANSPHLPVDINVSITGTNITKNVNIFKIKKMEWE
ncbi:hypothetical protein [Tenacibaculum finnmarkense]|uniref:hypothetical protein n=1 Tax=Tenacibaculum finnmarkense TaxID=2781243 RepID=UPI002300D546|nr:hypothetical protein [Tenacibaculum finnmarkense]WCC46193.1 hypothetical protein PJH08_07225 [Tenacibaculum finnmarkense]